jgi:hypothetical protein
MMKSAGARVSRLLGDGLDIKGRVERNPYGMVVGAIAVGYVLGGGLFTRLTERLAGATLRAGLLAALPRFEEEFLGRENIQGEGSTREKGEGI